MREFHQRADIIGSFLLLFELIKMKQSRNWRSSRGQSHGRFCRPGRWHACRGAEKGRRGGVFQIGLFQNILIFFNFFSATKLRRRRHRSSPKGKRPDHLGAGRVKHARIENTGPGAAEIEGAGDSGRANLKQTNTAINEICNSIATNHKSTFLHNSNKPLIYSS